MGKLHTILDTTLFSHAMKSSAALLGATGLSDACAEMESQAEAAEIDLLLEIYSRLRSQYDDLEPRILETLRHLVTRP